MTSSPDFANFYPQPLVFVAATGDKGMAQESDYASREQAWVKHWMLQRYLEQLIMKVGRRWKRFVYIDGYAGPWKSQSQDLSDTSFGSAIAVMRRCQQKLASQGLVLPMHAVFFEKHRLRAARLQQYARDHAAPGLTIEAHCADFIEHVGEVASKLGDKDFAFALIDPTGYGDMVPNNLAPLLRRRGVEVLINLMWDHINRFWHTDMAPVMDELFGADRRDRCMGDNLERSASKLYAERLREAAAGQGGRLRAAAFPVLHPTKQRTHYFLVYATHAPIGLLTFDEVAEATWHQQEIAKAKTKLRQQAGPQTDLWGNEVIDVATKRTVNAEEVRAAWLRFLPVAGSEMIVSDDRLADLLEVCSCFARDLQDEVRALIAEGVLENVSIEPARLKRRTRNVVQNGEKLRRLR